RSRNTGVAARTANRRIGVADLIFQHAAAVATRAAIASSAAISAERRAAITAGRCPAIPYVQKPDVVTSKEHNSVATIAAISLAAVSVAASAAVAASATVTASCVAAIATRSKITDRAARTADREFIRIAPVAAVAAISSEDARSSERRATVTARSTVITINE